MALSNPKLLNLFTMLVAIFKLFQGLIAAIATIGGLNDLFDVFSISDIAGQWIRFSITALTAVLNLLSTTFWPIKDKKI